VPSIQVQITRFVDDYQPGIVECQFADAHGRVWSFVEKLPYVTAADLWHDSEYPQPGTIRCEIVDRRRESGMEIVVVDTERPDYVESVEGVSRFEIHADILVE
jgi:hypothetical protein